MVTTINKNTSGILIAGFAVVLLCMAGLLVLNFKHIDNMSGIERLESRLRAKGDAVHKMRDIVRERSISLIRTLSLEEYFDRDAERQHFHSFANEFVATMETIEGFDLSLEEQAALENVKKDVRISQPLIETAVDLAVEGEWETKLRKTMVTAINSYSQVLASLEVFFKTVQKRIENEHYAHEKSLHQENQLTVLLGSLALIISLLIGIYVIRREWKRTSVLRGHVEDTEARYRSIVNTAVDAIVTADEHGIIETVNPATEEMYGYKPGELIGQDVKVLMAGMNRDHHHTYVNSYKDGGKPGIIGIGRELKAIRKDGTEMPIWLGLSEMKEGSERKFVAVMRDMTTMVKARDEIVSAMRTAEQASKTKNEFLANISHELRTPLNAIIGYAEMIESEILGTLGQTQYKEYLQHISSSGRHLSNLINDLLDITRIEADDFPLADETIDLGDTLETCITTVSPRVSEEGKSIHLESPEQTITVRADLLRLKQVLLNLIHNAIKFTDKDGHIEITTAVLGNGALEIRITDDGIGISQDDMERVFDMFAQADGSLSRRFEGIGLGLPLSRKLMEKHGGTLNLESGLERGTTAIVTLPADRVTVG